MKTKIILLLFILLISTQSVFSENWYLVTTTKDAKYYVDLDSIKKTLGNIEYNESGIFNKISNLTKAPFNKPFRVYKAQRKINCTKKSVLSKSITTFDNNKNPVNNLDKESITKDIEYGTIEAYVYNDYCGENKIAKKEKELEYKDSERICANPDSLESYIDNWMKKRKGIKITNKIYEEPTSYYLSEWELDFINTRRRFNPFYEHCGKKYTKSKENYIERREKCVTIFYGY